MDWGDSVRRHSYAAALAAWILFVPAVFAATSGKLPLWPNGAPGGNPNGGEEAVRVTEQGDHVVSNVHRPSLTVYLPKTNGIRPAVIVVPGGGYRELWTDHEGHNIAKYLNEQGIAAFVLYYRLPNQEGSTYQRGVEPLADIRRAIRTVRARAAEWSIDPKKVGVLGFSAGGHLVMQASTMSDAGDAAAADPVDRLDSRPDFAAPIYPGVGEWKIDSTTPPMFLLCGGDDRPQVITGITQIYLALHAAKVPAELHLYDGVGHGFGLRPTNEGPVTNWLREFVNWLQVRGVVK